jgi:tetratricopeptide (TPR) repeat protein
MEELLRREVAAAEARGDRTAVAAAWHALGEWLEPRRPDDEAAVCYERALSARPSPDAGRPDPADLAAELQERSFLMFRGDDYERSAELAGAGIDVALSAGLKRTAALLMYGKARALRLLADPDGEGTRLLRKAERLLRDDPLWLAAILEEQAWHARTAGDLEIAIGRLETAAAIRLKQDEPWAASHAYHELGRAAFDAADYERAVRFLRQAVAIREQYRIEAVRLSYHELARALGELGELEEAGALYQQSITADLAAEEPREAGISYHCWAANLMQAERYDEAAERLVLAIRCRNLAGDSGVRFSYWVLAQLEEERGRYEEAAAAYEQHAALSRQVDDPEEEADGYCALGEMAARQGDEERARTWLEKAVAVAPPLSTVGNRALISLGWQAIRLGQHAEALPCFEQVLAREEAAGLRQEMAETCRLIGDVLAGDDAEAAASWYRRAIGYCRETGAAAHEAAIQRRLGRMLHAHRNFGNARAALLAALEIDLREGTGAVSEDYYGLGHIDRARGDLEAAAGWFELCLAGEMEQGRNAEAAVTARSLAGVAAAAGDTTRQLRWLQEAESLALAAGEAEPAAEICSEISHVLRGEEREAEAEAAVRRALSHLEAAGEQRTEPLFQMGHLLAERDPEEAAAWYGKALESALAQEDLSDAAAACYWTGRLSRFQGDLSAAGLWFEKALAYAEASDDSLGRGYICREIGQFHTAVQDFEAARRWLEQSRNIQEELGNDSEVAAVLDDLAQVALQEERPALAAEYLQQALPLVERTGNRRAVSAVTFRLGRSLAQQGELEEARLFLEQSLAVDRELGDRYGQSVTCLELAVVALSEEDSAEAKRWLDLCLETGIPLEDEGAMQALQFRYGQVAEAEEQPAAAARHYHRVLSGTVSHRLEAAACLALGRLAREREELAEARSWMQRALAAASQAGDEELAEEAKESLDDLPLLN